MIIRGIILFRVIAKEPEEDVDVRFSARAAKVIAIDS